jgi:hypothetical protein
VPPTHRTQLVAPAALDSPALHGAHTLSVLAPTISEKRPAVHRAHTVAPSDEYLPAGQSPQSFTPSSLY